MREVVEAFGLRMKIGKIISLVDGPKRDTELRITAKELFSGISDPPGPITASEVVGYDVVECRDGGSLLYHLYVRLAGGSRVLFYTAAVQFDVALLLDEFEAALRKVPRTWTKAGNR